MEFIIVLLIGFINILLVNSQCSDWSGDDWSDDADCAAVHDPSPDTVTAFKGTRVPVAPQHCFPAPCPTTPQPPGEAVVVSYQRCLNFSNAYGADNMNPNRAWLQGWCLVEENGDGDHNCKAFKHGRRMFIPDSHTMNLFTKVITKWGNVDALEDNTIERWHTGLKFHNFWWQWMLSNGDVETVRPWRRNANLPWGDGEPDNDNGVANCGVYDWNKKALADFYCTSSDMVLCQYPSCVDTRRKCKYWAGQGQCGKNPVKMDRFCQKSCNCDCIDKNRKCRYWANNDECDRTFPGWHSTVNRVVDNVSSCFAFLYTFLYIKYLVVKLLFISIFNILYLSIFVVLLYLWSVRLTTYKRFITLSQF